MIYLDDFPTGFTSVCIPFDSFAASTGAPSATSSFVAGDVLIYKDGGTTQRSSSSGIVATTSFDSLTGMQMITIDLSDNTDAGFYSAGHEYQVAVSDVTIDGQTMRFWAACFSIERAGGTLALLKAGTAKVDVTKWLTGTIPAVNITGVPLVDNKYILGTVMPANATAGIQDVNTSKINNISASSVTTINANQGTTQPVNYTGTGGSALVKADMIDIASAAVSTSSAQIGVNTVNLGGQVVTAASGVTIPSSIASPTNITGGVITTVTNLTNAPTSGDLTATMKASVTTAATAATPTVSSVSGSVGSVSGNIGGNVVGSVGSVAGNIGGNIVGNLQGTLSTTERNAIADAFLARTLGTESYAALHAVPTVRQAIYATMEKNLQLSISGTTLTVYMLDGTTPAMTFTLNSASTPTSIIRAT